MSDMLANDMVLREDNCNLSCEYCLTGQSNFKKRHSLKLIFEPPKKESYNVESTLGRRMDQVVSAVEAEMKLPVIKVTGGEIFLINGIMDFLRGLSTRYASLVVQTNGVLVGLEAAREMRSWGNVCLQISLDAVSFEGNSYRSENRRQHELVLGRIFELLDVGIPTEIYLVLNDRSIPWLEDTLRSLMKWSETLVVCPFPVRGPDKEKFYPKPEQVGLVRSIVDRHGEFAAIVPPIAYWRRLLRFLEEGERSFRCHLPRFAFTTFDDGVVTPCPNIWFSTLGNVIQGNAKEVMATLGATAFYQILLAEKPRIDACKGCFTPWDMLSMFIDGEVTIDELCATPMYRAAECRSVIERIANRLRERESCSVSSSQPISAPVGCV